MSNNSSTGGSANARNGGHFCECGVKAFQNCSWTDANPGQRFLGCRNWQNGGCNYFQWIDPPMNARAREVILQLREERNMLLVRSELLREQASNARRMQLLLVVTWAIFLSIWFH